MLERLTLWAGSAGDLRHGEEHRAAEEVHPGQAGPHDGGPYTPGHPYPPSQRGAVPRPRPAQVRLLVPQYLVTALLP